MRVCERYQIDRIVSFAPFYTLLCFLPIKRNLIPAVTFIRADNFLHKSSWIRTLFFLVVDRFGLHMSSKIVFVSHSLLEVYKSRYNLDENKLFVLPNNIKNSFTVPHKNRPELPRSWECLTEVKISSTSFKLCGISAKLG